MTNKNTGRNFTGDHQEQPQQHNYSPNYAQTDRKPLNYHFYIEGQRKKVLHLENNKQLIKKICIIGSFPRATTNEASGQ